jgi:hypothetical protein
MEQPMMIAHLQQLFSEVSETDIAVAEPKNECPTPENGVRVVGTADEEMRVWWTLARAKEGFQFLPLDYFFHSGKDRKEISDRFRIGCADYMLAWSMFRALVAKKYPVGSGEDVVMYKGWVIGISTPSSRTASFGHDKHIRVGHVTRG